MDLKRLKPQLLTFIAALFLSGHIHGMCVNVKKANLRSGPSTKKQITWEVFMYMPLVRLNRKGSWYQVKDFEGDTHWVFKNLVTTKFKCAVVKVDKANLRIGPGSKFRQPSDLPSVKKYTVFKLIKIKGQWAQVKDSFGDTHWVFRKLVWIN